MKETVNVSISGIAFILDTESYVLLSDYLQRLRTSLRSDPDSSEIISDIESRIAELILSVQAADRPVSHGVIKDIIAQLGEIAPDIDAEALQEEMGGTKSGTLTRRLYRNPEGAKIGGVCSGLGTYFGIDPVIVRLLFLLPAVFGFGWAHWDGFGFGMSLSNTVILLYGILWITLPKARSARQILEMTGEPVTVRSIQHSTVRGRESNAAYPETGGSKAIGFLGNFLVTLVRIFCGIIGITFLLAGIAVIVTTLVSIFFGTGIAIFELQNLAVQTGLPLIIVLTALGTLISLPLLAIGYLLLSVAFSLPAGKTLMITLFIFWIILLIVSATIAAGHMDFGIIRWGPIDIGINM